MKYPVSLEQGGLIDRAVADVIYSPRMLAARLMGLIAAAHAIAEDDDGESIKQILDEAHDLAVRIAREVPDRQH